MTNRLMRPRHLQQRLSIGVVVTTLFVGGTSLMGNAIASPNRPSPVLYSQNSEDTGTTTNERDSNGNSSDSLESRFTCQYDDGDFVVMYTPESQPDEKYAWATPGAMGGGWTPERRCNAISDRLENYRPDGLLELKTGVENGYNVVCATTTEDSSCRIVFTVPNDQDPLETRDLVFENLAVANSGQETQGVRTFRDDLSTGSIFEQLETDLGFNFPQLPNTHRDNPSLGRDESIDLRPFLDPADGGTGVQL